MKTGHGVRIDWQKQKTIAPMDTGKSGSFISPDYAKRHQIKLNPTLGNMSMASLSLKASMKGQRTVNSNLLDEWYLNVKLCLLPNLCSDVILRQDFMSQDSNISLAFGGPKKSLVRLFVI